MSDYSIVEYFGEQISNHCGYCKSQEMNKHSHGMWAHKLSGTDYLALMDRGWRRSGQYVYKPTMDKTCCPQYTIRCDSQLFRPTRSQKRVLKRMRYFLKTGEKPKNSFAPQNERDAASSFEQSATSSVMKASNSDILLKEERLSKIQTLEKPKKCEESSEVKSKYEQQQISRRPRKKKQMRKERALAKLAAKGIDSETAEAMRREKMAKPKQLEELLLIVDKEEQPNAHKLELRTERSDDRSDTFVQSFDESYAVYWKYQTVVHKEAPDELSQSQYRRFLCQSPIPFVDAKVEGHPGYGSFHQQYLLDGKIIAVGVIDILAQCISSKYLYYDPDYAFLNLGTYSALCEIAFIRKLNKTIPDLRWYYMGFYIHSCQKMKYKSRFRPAFLLCPESYLWVAIEKCLTKLDSHPYSRLTDVTDAVDEDGDNVSVGQVTVLYDHSAMFYAQLSTLGQRNDLSQVEEYSHLVGRSLSRRILLYRHD